ncbi:MAG: hypothetical protein OQK75_08505 [Gammaproteobacteria bacterium]|nr:hypothetical protein [Gammaproteobacteria bacterium]MCW8987695.1 hypothetical protein [Gammaproteobacteria bacterium]MCW9032299.1 hypothetical protein [Gammaproteobacteria bacterium]
MKNSISPVIFFILISLMSAVSQANPQRPSPYIQLAQASQNLDSAVQSVKQQTGGRILSAKTINKNGLRVHKIKVLLPSGKVQVFSINAQ